MKIYLIYDTKDNELFVMRGTAKSLGRRLDVEPRKIREYSHSGYLVKRRYRVILEEEEEEEYADQS